MGGADRVDLIEVACFHCGKPFDVCIRDYRGQRYCEKDCRELAIDPAAARQAADTSARRRSESGIAVVNKRSANGAA
jgi:hypothetical protein